MAAVTLTFDNPLLDDGATTETTEGTEKIAEGDDGVEGTGAAEHEGRGGEREDADAPGRPQASEGESDAGEGRTDDAGRGEWDEADEVSEVLLADRRRIRRPLPIDADEVSVERRLYRDGKSQYLINGKLARLKDIRDLFLDTGIGADAYSIIEQGKVDAMLLASPQERRTIFEEAAGIAKYKQRRIEAQRKLEKAEQNLVRTREALDSTERRLRIVRGQAEVASTSGLVRSVALEPPDPPACAEAVKAIEEAEAVVLGPGSWFTSVLVHLLVPELADALRGTPARRVLALNLSPQIGETRGFSPERHLEVLAEHAPGLRLDVVIADQSFVADQPALTRAAGALGAELVMADVARDDGTPRHDPARLAAVYAKVL